MKYIQISNTNSNYSIGTEFDGELYTLEFRYNTRAEKWAFSFKKKDADYIFQGVFLVLGIDYFAIVQREDIPTGTLGMVNLTNSDEPNFDNFGVNCKMVYISDDE